MEYIYIYDTSVRPPTADFFRDNLSGVWEASGEASETHLGGIWEASGTHLATPGRLQEAPLGLLGSRGVLE